MSAEKSIASPKLYIPGQSNQLFNKYTFIRKLVHGVVTSCLLFFIPYAIFKENVTTVGLAADNKDNFAVCVGAILVLIVNIQVCIDPFSYASSECSFVKTSYGRLSKTSAMYWQPILTLTTSAHYILVEEFSS